MIYACSVYDRTSICMLVIRYKFIGTTSVTVSIRYNVISSYPVKSNTQSIEDDNHISVETTVSNECRRLSKNISKDGKLHLMLLIFNISIENNPTLYWHKCSPDIVVLLKLQLMEGFSFSSNGNMEGKSSIQTKWLC